MYRYTNTAAEIYMLVTCQMPVFLCLNKSLVHANHVCMTGKKNY
jgi:hypothetical protein